MAKVDEAVKTAPPVKKEIKVMEFEAPKVESKNKVYKLKGLFEHSPWFRLQSGDQPGNGSRLLFFDKETKSYKSIRYAINYPSPFVDDQRAAGYDIVSEQILFENGHLFVPAENKNLQVLLEHHPMNELNGGKVFYEFDPTKIAKEEMNYLKVEAEAMKVAFDMDINTASALLRGELGADIHEMKSDILTREVLRSAKSNPVKFLESTQDLESLMVKYIAYTSIDFGICSLTDSKQVYRWADNGQKLLSIPFGEDTFSYIANWFTTDDGLEVMGKITSKLKK